jgi:hypothetical protein
MSKIGRTIAPWAAWAAFAVPLLLFATSAWTVVRTYSPTPFWDQWANIMDWQDVLKHGLTFDYLFSQHNEHRIFFPRLVFLADLKWFEGRDILNLAAIGLVQVLGAALFLHMAGLRRARPLAIMAAAVATALLFSLVQSENLTWGFQEQFVEVFAAGSWAIYLFMLAAENPDKPRWLALAGAMGLLLVAAFSLSNGFFAGVAMVLVGVITGRDRKLIAIAVATTVLLALIYMHGYHSVAGHSPPSLALQHPGRYLFYIVGYLGNPWALGSFDRALDAGFVGVAATLAMAAMVAAGKVRDSARSAMFGVVLFIGITAAVTALGRLSFGLEQALSSRYTTPGGYFWAAQAIFWGLTCQDSASPARQWGVSAAFLAALVLLLPIQARAYDDAMPRYASILLGSSAMLSGNPDDAALGGVYPDPQVVKQFTPFLREHRLSLFADGDGVRLGSAFRANPMPAREACRGFFDGLDPEPHDALAARGWSWDSARKHPFDRVLIVDSANRVIGEALGGLPRPDVRKALHKGAAAQSGWVASIDGHATGVLTAYGLRPDGKTCALGAKTVAAPQSKPAA